MKQVGGNFANLGRKATIAIGSIVLFAYLIGPVAWMAMTAIQPESDVVSVPPKWVPDRVTVENFRVIFSDTSREITYETRRQADATSYAFVPTGAANLVPSLLNSLKVGLVVAALNLILSFGAAYALSVIPFRGRGVAFGSVLVTRVVPDIALVVPIFLVVKKFGLIDTPWSLIITYLAIKVPYTVFILMNYFSSIPRDLYKAARVDGCTHLGVLWHVYLPLSLPAIAASILFAFLTSWNEYVFALILTRTIDSQTIPIIISSFVMDFTTSFSFINAAGVIAIIPPVLLALLFERYIVSGLTAGAVKG